MSISEYLEDVKVSLKDIKKKKMFDRANKSREANAALQAELMKASGKLEICRKDFNRIIKTQSRNVSEGQRQGVDTIIQEQMLWDAAIGYMLVRDAMFSLKTINSDASVTHAYDMLDAAMKQMAGKKGGLTDMLKSRTDKVRNSYGYITSNAAVKEKEDLLDTFFERLKVNGDIEECLAIARNPALRDAERRSAYTGGAVAASLSGENEAPLSDADEAMRRLAGLDDSGSSGSEFDVGIDTVMDIQPPKDIQ